MTHKIDVSVDRGLGWERRPAGGLEAIVMNDMIEYLARCTQRTQRSYQLHVDDRLIATSTWQRGVKKPLVTVHEEV